MANYRKDGLESVVFRRRDKVNKAHHDYYDGLNFPSTILAQINWGVKTPHGLQPDFETLKNRLCVRMGFRLCYYATYRTTDDNIEEIYFPIGNLVIKPEAEASTLITKITNPHDNEELAEELNNVKYFKQVDRELSRLSVRIPLGRERDWFKADSYSFTAFQNQSISRIKISALKPEDRVNIEWIEYLVYLARLEFRAEYQAFDEPKPTYNRERNTKKSKPVKPTTADQSAATDSAAADLTTETKSAKIKPSLSKLELSLKQAKQSRNDCLLKLGSLNLLKVLEQEVNALVKEFGPSDIYRKVDVAYNMLTTKGVYNSSKASSEASAREQIQCLPSAATNDDWNDQWEHVILHPEGLFKRHEGKLKESPNDYLQLFTATMFNARSLRYEQIELITDGFSRESNSKLMDGVEFGYNGSEEVLTSQKRCLLTWERLSGVPLSMRINEGSLNDLFAYYRQLGQIKDVLSYTGLVNPFNLDKIPENYNKHIEEGSPIFDVQQLRHMHDQGLNMPEIVTMHMTLGLPVAAFLHLRDQKVINLIEKRLKVIGPLGFSRGGINIRIQEIKDRIKQKKKITSQDINKLADYFFTIKIDLQETGWISKLKNRAKEEDPNSHLFKWLKSSISSERWKELGSEELTFVVMPSYVSVENFKRELTQLYIECELHNWHNPQFKPLKKVVREQVREVRLSDLPLLKEYDLEDSDVKELYDEHNKIMSLPKNKQHKALEIFKKKSWEYKAEEYKATQSKKLQKLKAQGTYKSYSADNPVMFYLPNYEEYKSKFNNRTYKVLVHTCKTNEEAVDMIQYRGDIEPNFSDLTLIGTKSCQVSSDQALGMKVACELLAVTFKKVVLAKNEQVISQLKNPNSEKAKKLRITDFYQWLRDLDGFKVSYNYASGKVKTIVEISTRCRLAWEKIGEHVPTEDELNRLLNKPRKHRERLRKLSGKLTLLERGRDAEDSEQDS